MKLVGNNVFTSSLKLVFCHGQHCALYPERTLILQRDCSSTPAMCNNFTAWTSSASLLRDRLKTNNLLCSRDGASNKTVSSLCCQPETVCMECITRNILYITNLLSITGHNYHNEGPLKLCNKWENNITLMILSRVAHPPVQYFAEYIIYWKQCINRFDISSLINRSKPYVLQYGFIWSLTDRSYWNNQR
jgi:hypothetical protein